MESFGSELACWSHALREEEEEEEERIQGRGKKKWLFGILFDVAAALTAAERSGSLDELHKNW